MERPKDECRVFQYYQEAIRAFNVNMIIAEGNDTLEKAERSLIMNIKYKDGRRVWFLTESQEPTWSLGRTYIKDGEICYSGHPIAKEGEHGERAEQ